MSLTVAGKNVENADHRGAWLLSGHNSEVLSISTDGAVFATCDTSGTGLLWVWDESLPSGARHAAKVSTSGPTIIDSSFLRHTRLCTAQGDGTVGVWDVETGQREHTLCRLSGRGKATNWPVLNTVTTLNDDSVAFGGDDGFVVISSPLERKTLAVVNLKVPITSLAATTNFLFVGDVLGKIHCLDLRTFKTFYSIQAHRDVVTSVTLNENSSMMVSYGMDNSLGLWDIQPFAFNTDDRILQRIELQQGDSRNLLRCSWSGKENIAVPTSDGLVVHLKVSMLEGSKVVFPVRHSGGPTNCASLLSDDVVLSAAGSEVILQHL